MNERIYKIWCNTSFANSQIAECEMLLNGIGAHEISLFEPTDNGRDGESNYWLKQSDIVFGLPDADTIINCDNLRWFQINSAGYTAYDRQDLYEIFKNRGTILTNSSSVYEESCAQHILGMMLSFARALPFAHQAQRDEQTWQMNVLRARIQLLNGQTALILGFGAIGKRIAQLLAPFEMNLIGVRRIVRGNEFIETIEEARVDEFFPRADHVINILPANDSTKNFVNAARLKKIKRGAIVYNIGRGTTIDQNALIKALNSGQIGGAFLDVADPEPLPPDNPLWHTPNCFITPHVAGGHAREKEMQVKHFLANLRRFERHENLINRII